MSPLKGVNVSKVGYAKLLLFHAKFILSPATVPMYISNGALTSIWSTVVLLSPGLPANNKFKSVLSVSDLEIIKL